MPTVGHRSTGRRRRIGPIGTTARLIVGGLLLGSVIQGHLAGPFRPAAWTLGLLGFPALLLGWQWLRARAHPNPPPGNRARRQRGQHRPCSWPCT